MTDDNDSPKITRRRALGSIALVGAAGAGIGAGTTAYFSDSATSEQNTIESGEVVLNPGDGSINRAINVGSVAPGQSGSSSLSLTNDGSIGGYLSLDFGTPDNRNDLTEVLKVTVSIGGNVIRKGTFDTVFDGEGEWSNADIALPANATKNLEFEWALPGGTGNDAEDSTAVGEFDILLNQQQEAFADVIVPDDASSIQDAVNDVPAGGVVLVRNGTYDEAIQVTEEVKLAAKNSGGATLNANTNNVDNKAIRVDGASGVTVSGLDITLTGPVQEKYGIRARTDSNDLTVRDCTFRDYKSEDQDTNSGGAVRAVGVTVTAVQPNTGTTSNPTIENCTFDNIRCVGEVGPTSTSLDDDSKAKGVALNGDIPNAAVVCSDFTNIGAASTDPSGAQEADTGNSAQGTDKTRGVSITEDSSGNGPRNFTILENTFTGLVGTYGQPALFVGGVNNLGSDHEVYNNTFEHPVDNLADTRLVLRDNDWGDPNFPDLVLADEDKDGGNLIIRNSTFPNDGGSYDTTYSYTAGP